MDFNKLYAEYERKYNQYPVQMSRAEVFGRMMADGIIDEEQHRRAHLYFGNLWFYTGD